MITNITNLQMTVGIGKNYYQMVESFVILVIIMKT